MARSTVANVHPLEAIPSKTEAIQSQTEAERGDPERNRSRVKAVPNEIDADLKRSQTKPKLSGTDRFGSASVSFGISSCRLRFHLGSVPLSFGFVWDRFRSASVSLVIALALLRFRSGSLRLGCGSVRHRLGSASVSFGTASARFSFRVTTVKSYLKVRSST